MGDKWSMSHHSLAGLAAKVTSKGCTLFITTSFEHCQMQKK